MKKIEILLTSEPSGTFRCQKAANSLDIDIKKKLTHKFEVVADVEDNYNVGLIFGASGSGKTTLAKKIYGDHVFEEILDLNRPVIDQFPENYSYEDCASFLTGVGLSQVTCWIRPARSLSNGQRARAEIALQLAQDKQFIVIDEWTSVVDRTVAKIMSNCVQKHARRTGKKIVLCSCHYDVIEWLNPDWVIDCNKQEYIDRRLLWQQYTRSEKLRFEIKECDTKCWKYFSKYHYLSDRLPGGVIYTFGLYHGDNQIGFQCFANYVPCLKGEKMKLHSNRTVIHPDYVGLGLGILVINETSKIMAGEGFEIMAKFSSAPIKKSFDKYKDKWQLFSVDRKMKSTNTGNMGRGKSKGGGGFREKVKTYSYRYIDN